ncbi:aquaporin [Roseococcus sp. DSY-14]|uniref:aquaporin n=1 Tax=Roseococcus sp. DSY-14 TaxID=3369650 RepID=UPI00387B7FFE
MADAARRAVAEGLATALLLATVVGSGIMAERLAGGNGALALLGNALATGAMLPVLIWLFGPLSGAAMNPAVTLVQWRAGAVAGAEALRMAAAQAAGALAGVALAHAMFGLPLVQAGGAARGLPGHWLAEAVATAGLVWVVLGVPAGRVAVAVGLYITAAYWFTASTSFANPAVTLARGFTASFSGIALADVPGFVAAQLAGALGAAALWRWLSPGLPGPRPMRQDAPCAGSSSRCCC